MNVHPVADAVEPLKADAIDRASLWAHEVIERYAAMLGEAAGDANKAAPYPDSRTMNSHRYAMALAVYRRMHSLSKSTSRTGCRRPSEPDTREMDVEMCERFIEQCKESAAAQYDTFVAKLVGKIGECETATLTGNHVWGRSTLTVGKADGSVERWNTKQIVNVSKLGLLFNQWPTRKAK